MILLDSDHLSILQHPDGASARILAERLDAASDDDVVISVVTVEEQLRSWLGLIGRQGTDVRRQVPYYERLLDLIRFLQHWRIAPFDARASETFRLLRARGVRGGTMDLKIASIALANDALLLTANLQDFVAVPGLRVENWLTD